MDQLPSLTEDDTQPSVELPLFEEPPVDETHKLSSPRPDDSTLSCAAVCHFCGKGVDPKSDTTYAEVRSWVSGPKKDSAVLRQYTGLYADGGCISLLRSGLHPLQKTLEETVGQKPVSELVVTPLVTDRSDQWNEGFSDGFDGKGFRIDGEDYVDGYEAGKEQRELLSGSEHQR